MWRGSKPIDPGFGTETQIRIKIEVKDMIEAAKIIPQEPLNDCLKRVFLFYKEHQSKEIKGKITTNRKPDEI